MNRAGYVLVLFVLVLVPVMVNADHAVNINTDGKEALTTLTGIGEVKAQNIIDYREANGPFSTKEEIKNVSGIGPATYDNIKDHIVITGGASEEEEDQPQEETDEQESESTASQGNGPPPYQSPEPTFFAYAGEDRDVIVGAGTLFEGQAISKEGNEIIGDVRYIWNFGDGETAEGKKVMHVWKHPGRYALVLDIAHNKKAASDRIVITARPAEVLVSTEDESIVVANEGSRDLDLSTWHLRAGGLHFTVPENTLILAGEQVRFSQETTNLDAAGGDVALLYPNGVVAAEQQKKEEIDEVQTSPSAASAQRHSNSVVGTRVVESNHQQEREVVEKESKPKAPATSSQAAAVSQVAEGSFFPSGVWLYGLGALIVLGAVGAAAARSKSREEYTIIEE